MTEKAEKFLTHREPLWRDRSDFIINAELLEKDGGLEQLWVRQITDNTFEICCVPFFLYDLALGDVVQTLPARGRTHMLSKVVQASGRHVFRVWFGRSSQPRDDVAAELVKLGGLIEWSSPNLLAVDAADEAIAEKILVALQAHAHQRGFEYEVGHT